MVQCQNFVEKGFHKSREFLVHLYSNDGVLKKHTVLCSQLLDRITNQRRVADVASSCVVRLQHSSVVYQY